MKLVKRSELLDFLTYTDHRDEIRKSALAAKYLRRVIVADILTFLFENAETIRYQILEMIRVEQIVREADIDHELATYNELIGQDGELGCTILIGIDDPEARDEKLRQWLSLPNHLYVRMADGSKIRATWDPRQIGEARLSSVQYVKFPVKGETPVACGCDMPGLSQETSLTKNQQVALKNDLTEV